MSVVLSIFIDCHGNTAAKLFILVGVQWVAVPFATARFSGGVEPMSASQIRSAQHRSRAAFTLVELLIAVTIISMLAGLSASGIYTIRQRMSKAHCQANLREIGIMFRLYLDNPRNARTFPDAARMPSIDSKKRSSIAQVLDRGSPPPKKKKPVDVFGNPVDSSPGQTEEPETRATKLDSIFRCPDDEKYFAQEGLSYEYPGDSSRGGLAKRTESEILNGRSGRGRLASFVILMYDFQNIHHGSWIDRSSDGDDSGQSQVTEERYLGRGRNFLYLDGHVDDGLDELAAEDDSTRDPTNTKDGSDPPGGSTAGGTTTGGSTGGGPTQPPTK